MGSRILLTLVALVLSIATASSQDKQVNQDFFPTGISIQYGKGTASMSDNYISRENYKGTLTGVVISWSWFQRNKGYRIGIWNNYSNNFKNNTVSADYNQTALFLDLVYRVGKFSLFSKDIYLYAGPGLELFDYYVNNSFASFARSESEGSLTSLGANLNIVYPLKDWLRPEIMARTSLFSFANKSFDQQRYPDSNSDSKLVFVNRSVNMVAEFGIRFVPVRKFTLKVSYNLHVSKIREWDDYTSVDNIFSAAANYTF